LAAEWSITYGRPLDGGNAAYVIEAVTADARPVILKVVLPPGVDGFSPFEQELEALRLAGGDPYAELIRHDSSRRSMLLERLGPSLASLGWPRVRRADHGREHAGPGVAPGAGGPSSDGRGEG
jgi:streptomycin 6-kinase